MFRNFLKNKKAQNTAEYALLIALVVAGIIAMQQYAQRSLQARVRDAAVYMATETKDLGVDKTKPAVQYEPYYLQSNYEIDRQSAENVRLGEGLVAKDGITNRAREEGGFQQSTYSGTENVTPVKATMPSDI